MTKTMERPETQVVVRPSTYATILVHAEPGLASTHRVEAAARLARTLDARLIGLGAETFEPTPYSAGAFTTFGGAELVGAVQAQIEKNLIAAEAAFRRDAGDVEVEWRTVQDYPHRAISNTAHIADLIVVSPKSDRGSLVSADPADVVMTAGRPVLVVPEGHTTLVGMNVVVAWKNTPECRRAVTDALPFLQRADEVVVLAVAKPGMIDAATSETADVVANLKRRGVDARALVTSNDTGAVEDEIERVAALDGADLIVAGAYGHSRVREWAFGGVTESYLREPRRFVLLSH